MQHDTTVTRTFLGIDAGGTQTLAVVISEDGDVLGLGKVLPTTSLWAGCRAVQLPWLLRRLWRALSSSGYRRFGSAV